MAYLDGTLELVRPSKDHERIKSYLGRLVEAYALERPIDLSPFGSWTLWHAPAAAGLDPDEGFILGPEQVKPIPDLAIEVIWTSGGIDKLEIDRRLDGDRFERVERSRLFPGLDLDLLVSLLDRPTALQAIRALRPALAG
jgi:Uma2 family endonuclease